MTLPLFPSIYRKYLSILNTRDAHCFPFAMKDQLPFVNFVFCLVRLRPSVLPQKIVFFLYICDLGVHH